MREELISALIDACQGSEETLEAIVTAYVGMLTRDQVTIDYSVYCEGDSNV